MISSTDSMMRSSGSLSARAMSGYRRRLRSSKCSSTISTDTGSGFGSALSWMSRHSWMERAATPGGSKACTMATTLRTSSTVVWQRCLAAQRLRGRRRRHVGRRLAVRLLGRLGLHFLEQRIFEELFLHDFLELEGAELQQLDGLLQQRSHDDPLALSQGESGFH